MKTKLTDFSKLTVADLPWLVEHVHALEKGAGSPATASTPKASGVSALAHSKLKAELSETNKFLGKVIKERDELKASLKTLQEDYDKLAETVGEPMADEPIPYVVVDEPAVEPAPEPVVADEAAPEPVVADEQATEPVVHAEETVETSAAATDPFDA